MPPPPPPPAGELEAESGLVWKHPNLRVAYVAQHAFHHIESHLDMTPNQYIQWRYATGEDRESLDKVSRKVRAEQPAGGYPPPPPWCRREGPCVGGRPERAVSEFEAGDGGPASTLLGR